jgi:hypothetical protein
MTLLVNLSPLLLLVGFVWLALRANRKFKKASQMTPGSTQFENLVALEAYDVDETGYWRRLPWVTGLFFGVAMAFMTPLIPSTSYSPAMTAVLSFAIGGPIFGLFFPMGLRRQIRGIWAGLYAGGPRSINPPTANGLYYYQIPCTSVRGKTGIIGVLYVGRGGLLFAPRKRSWKPGPTLEISPLDAVSIALVPPLPQNVIQRLLIPRPLEQIEIRWNGASARFLMPRPADTCSKIVRSLETLRRIPK